MKKLLIAALSVFVLTNIPFAQSLQHKIDSLENKIARLEQEIEKTEQELKPYLQAKRAENEAKRKKAEELYKQRFPEFVVADIDSSVKFYIVNELMKNPNWDITDIYLTKDGRYIVKSTSNSKGVELKLSKAAYEWHQNREDFPALYKMKTHVVAFLDAFTDAREDPWTWRFVINSKIMDLNCRQVKIFYKSWPIDSYVKYINDTKSHLQYYGKPHIFFFKQDGSFGLIDVKCVIDKDNQKTLFYGSTDLVRSEYKMGEYLYKPKRFQSADKVIRFTEDKMKKDIRVDSLQLQHIKTFNLADYK